MFLLLEKALGQGDAGACNKRLSAGTEPVTAKGMWAGFGKSLSVKRSGGLAFYCYSLP